MTDELADALQVDDAHGWVAEFEGREVALSEKTWAAWVLRSAEDPLPPRRLSAHQERMPILVLDEGNGARRSRSSPFPCAPATAPGRARADGPARGLRLDRPSACSAILANQAAATLSLIQRQGEHRAGGARRAHRPLQPPRLRRAARPGGGARGPAGGRALRPAPPRPRPLQEAQRHLRPSRRRRGAQERRRRCCRRHLRRATGRALRRRGVRGDPARRPTRRAPCTWPSACARRSRSDQVDLRGRADHGHGQLRPGGLAGDGAGARRAPGRGRPRALRGQAGGAQPRGGGSASPAAPLPS